MSMAENKETAQEITLDATTFDLDAFIQNNVTWPEYTAKVCVAGKAGARLDQLREEAKFLEQKIDQLRRRDPGKSEGSLGSATPIVRQIHEAESALEEIKAEGRELLKTVEEGMLKFTLRARDRDVYPRVLEVMRVMHPELADKTDSAILNVVTEVEKYAVTQQVALLHDLTVELEIGGKTSYPVEQLTFARVNSIMSGLSGADRNHLAKTMNLTLSGAQRADRMADAGFLG